MILVTLHPIITAPDMFVPAMNAQCYAQEDASLFVQVISCCIRVVFITLSTLLTDEKTWGPAGKCLRFLPSHRGFESFDRC